MGQSKTERWTLYVAAPLFTQAERRWNRELAQELARRLGCTVILPQDFCGGGGAGGAGQHAELYRLCVEGVEEADAVVAVLDGADADSGTAFEMGYACALGKPIIGVRTDYRQQHERGTNLMLAGSCAAFVHIPAFHEELGGVAAAISRQVQSVLGMRR